MHTLGSRYLPKMVTFYHSHLSDKNIVPTYDVLCRDLPNCQTTTTLFVPHFSYNTTPLSYAKCLVTLVCKACHWWRYGSRESPALRQLINDTTLSEAHALTFSYVIGVGAERLSWWRYRVPSSHI